MSEVVPGYDKFFWRQNSPLEELAFLHGANEWRHDTDIALVNCILERIYHFKQLKN